MNPPAIQIPDDLRRSIVDCATAIRKMIDAHNAAGPSAGHVCSFVHLRDATDVINAIISHWSKTLPTIVVAHMAPFGCSAQDYRSIYNHFGAFKAMETLNMFQAHRPPSQEKIDALLLVLDRALEGKPWLTEGLPNDLSKL